MFLIQQTKNLSPTQREQINALWNLEYPVNLMDRFPLLLNDCEDHNHYIIADNGNIIAWAVDFLKDQQVRFSIIVSEAYKGLGLGKQLIETLWKSNGEFYGWVIDHNNDVKSNGEKYLSPLKFYLKLGAVVLNEERLNTAMIQAVKIKFPAKIHLETERFLMREFISSDADVIYALDSNREVMRYLGNNIMIDKASAIQTIQHVRKQYEDNGIGRWMIIDKSSGEALGWAGLKLEPTEINGHNNYMDIGYRLLQQHWGKGIASECAKACLEFAKNELKLNKLHATAHVDNRASNRILQRIGMTRIATFDLDGEECNWYEITF